MLLTACDPELVYVEDEIPDELMRACAEPTKGLPTEGGFAELAYGWKATARCNADKLRSIREITGPQ
jgi:hypothetical protein